jgi:RNA polymerase sigma-70 factor (ECF subfamily)
VNAPVNAPKTTAILDAARDSSPPLAPELRARLAALVEAHFDFVWRTLRRLGLPRAGADDAAQQTFLVVAGRLGALAQGAERAFLYRTACHVAANARRATARRRDRTNDTDLVDVADPAPGPDEMTERRRARRMLDDVLEELDNDARQVFVLFELEAMQVPEIATLLEIPEGTCASRLRRAREQFQSALRRLRAKQSFGRRPR